MQNFIRILEQNKANLFRETEVLKLSQKESVEWHLINTMELTAMKLNKRLRKILPEHVELTTEESKIEFLAQPRLNQRTEFLARFYEMSQKEFLIKVFSHQVNGKGKSLKVAKARYRMRIKS